MNDLPEGISIKELSFDEIQKAEETPGIAGWVYPKRNVSQTIPLFSTGQRAALNSYGWVAGAMVVAGIVLPFILGNWTWVLLVPGAVVVWRANRKSMENFFLQNVSTDQKFYDAIRESNMGTDVKVVLTGPRSSSAVSGSKDLLMTEENRRASEDRAQIISAYGKFIETRTMTPDEIADVKLLPFPKEELLEAICLELIREPDESKRSAMEVGAILLANFQEGVGDEPLSMFGFQLPSEQPATDEETLELAKKLTEENPKRQRWEEFNARVKLEGETILARTKAAEQVRQAMPEDKKREILG
jgi:hypothetical protein